MSLSIALVAVLLIAGLAFWAAFRRARSLRTNGRLHSLPIYHGLHAALWTAVPALLLLAAWSFAQPGLVDRAVLASPAAAEAVVEQQPDDGLHVLAAGLADDDGSGGGVEGGVDRGAHPLSQLRADRRCHRAGVGPRPLTGSRRGS